MQTETLVQRSWFPIGAHVQRPRVLWLNVIGIGTVHLLALLAFVPWLFSWTGAISLLLGMYVFGVLGTNVCFHRLLTHRGFRCPLWLERTMAVLGVCCLQDTPAWWVATHRLHHQHADEEPDPHSPLVNFLWSHMGWLFFEDRSLNRMDTYQRYARDVLQDPFYFRMERNLLYAWIYVAQTLVFFLVGMAGGWLFSGQLAEGVRMGLSLVVWGVLVRTVLVWHVTWSVNSLTHLWGYRNYETGENSRNNWLVGYLAAGEGWHNNHHAFPRSARHGLAWWEIDVTYATIRLMERVGLAWDVVEPPSKASSPAA